MDENKRRGTKSKQRVVATIFGIQKMVLFVWVCIVFMNLFICSLWLSQLPSAERLHFINTAWHSQESILKTYAHSILIWGFWKKRINKSKTTKYANINTLPLKLGPLFSYCLENMHIRGHSHTGNNCFCLSEHKQHHTFNIYWSCCYYKPCLAKFIRHTISPFPLNFHSGAMKG